MQGELEVIGEVEQGVIILTIRYGPELVFARGAVENMRDSLVDRYSQMLQDPDLKDERSCVVVIDADTAGSPLVRALFELYKVVTRANGKLVVGCYPEHYIESLSALLLPALGGFSLAASRTDALNAVVDSGPSS